MAVTRRDEAGTQLREITECSICMTAFTDPRMLPCIHTFCFECLKRTSEAAQKQPGDKLPCPLCRKEFIIPADEMNGVQKNFFVENLLEFRTELQSNHSTFKTESENAEEIKRMTNVKYCTKHTQKPLHYYCADCKEIVCVSCFVNSHKSHDCNDVTAVDEEFRQTLEKISTYANEIMSLRKNTEKRKEKFLKEIIESEKAIQDRNQQLKDMIDRDTRSLFDELSAIKSKHLKQMECEIRETDRSWTILNSVESYCNEVRSKGSAGDICHLIDQLIVRADESEKDHEEFIGHPYQSVEVSFQATDLGNILSKSNSNFVGEIKETTTHFENCAILVGLDDGPTLTKDVIKINLHRSNEISTQRQIRTTMGIETVAAVYCNTMYVTGLGVNRDEIWKYNFVSGWIKCASLVLGRSKHTAAFIDEVLYICGGLVDSNGRVRGSVEAYNAVADKCTIVGKLVHCVKSSGDCVPFMSSIYIFGGSDKDNKAFNHVQVYNTEQNTCTLLSKPLPCSYSEIRSVLWETSVILLGRDTCFIFNFETETWQERKQFKSEVAHFGLVLENERVFVIGGAISETDKDGTVIWKCREDVRYVPLRNIIEDKPIDWKIHAKLPKPALIEAYSKLAFFVPSTKAGLCLVQ